MPDVLVRGVLDELTRRGFPAPEEVRTADETLVFALPRELRRALKAAGKDA